MSASDLLQKAKIVNVREAQAQLAKLVRSKLPAIVLSHGKPFSFLVPYLDMLDLVETLEELMDKNSLEKLSELGENMYKEKLYQQCCT